jgi:hypothetical protein
VVAAAAADLVLESEDVARWLERSAFFVAEVEMVVPGSSKLMLRFKARRQSFSKGRLARQNCATYWYFLAHKCHRDVDADCLFLHHFWRCREDPALEQRNILYKLPAISS